MLKFCDSKLVFNSFLKWKFCNKINMNKMVGVINHKAILTHNLMAINCQPIFYIY